MDANCIFCRIARKEIPSSVVFEDDAVIAFNDINPQAPVHVLVIPKSHVSSFVDGAFEESAGLEKSMLSAAVKVAKEKGLDRTGFRLVVNHGRDGGQEVPHLHFHVLGGRALKWPPG